MVPRRFWRPFTHATPRISSPCICLSVSLSVSLSLSVSAGSSSRGGDVANCVFDINQPSLPTPFYSVLVSVSVFMALSTVFHSINSDNSPLSHSVLLVFFLPAGPFFYTFPENSSMFFVK